MDKLQGLGRVEGRRDNWHKNGRQECLPHQRILAGRFLMIKEAEEESRPTKLHITFNWFDKLRRCVPTGK